ncbi:MAG: polyprenyl synthetase family protein [Bacteroidota bacterium]
MNHKTALFIKSCCNVGACPAGADSETIEKMGNFGLAVGMAFQIKDDLFDYGSFNIGKPRGIDIKEKKMTLPLIHALEKASSSEARRIRRLVKQASKKKEAVQEVIEFVKRSGGLEYATSVMEKYHQKAKDILRSLPETIYKKSLEDLVQFTIERTK